MVPVSLAAGEAAHERLTKFAPVLLIQLYFAFLSRKLIADSRGFQSELGLALVQYIGSKAHQRKRAVVTGSREWVYSAYADFK